MKYGSSAAASRSTRTDARAMPLDRSSSARHWSSERRANSRIDLVSAVPAAQDPRVITRAGARIGRAVRVDQRDPGAGGAEMMRGPRAEHAGTDHDNVRHRADPILRRVRLQELLSERDARGGAGARRAARARSSALSRLRPPVPDPRRRDGRVQGAIQPRRPAVRAVGLRRRRAVRPGREEAVLPCLSGRARLQLRDARLRSALRLLSELGDVAGAARSRGRRPAARRDARVTRRRRATSGRADARLDLQRAAHHRRVGGRDLSGSARAPGSSPASSRTATARPRVLEYIRPHIDLYKVDLKSFDDRRYRELGGRLAPILDTIQWLHDAGVWVEIVTLLVPGLQRQRERTARAHRVSRRRLTGHSRGT